MTAYRGRRGKDAPSLETLHLMDRGQLRVLAEFTLGENTPTLILEECELASEQICRVPSGNRTMAVHFTYIPTRL
jgi:hypothetical protein